MIQLLYPSRIFNVSVWKEINDFGIMEIRLLVTIFTMLKEVLMFLAKTSPDS